MNADTRVYWVWKAGLSSVSYEPGRIILAPAESGSFLPVSPSSQIRRSAFSKTNILSRALKPKRASTNPPNWAVATGAWNWRTPAVCIWQAISPTPSLLYGIIVFFNLRGFSARLPECLSRAR